MAGAGTAMGGGSAVEAASAAVPWRQRRMGRLKRGAAASKGGERRLEAAATATAVEAAAVERMPAETASRSASAASVSALLHLPLSRVGTCNRGERGMYERALWEPLDPRAL